MGEPLFSENYEIARETFRQHAKTAGAALDAIELNVTGPGDESLTIDLARLGAEVPERVLIHFSGLHGVEGFAGSATQLRILETPPDLSQRDALLLVHAVNPFGMAWLRRVNENNVDLNRNFLAPNESHSGSPDGYASLDSFLNPKGPPTFVDLFYISFFRHVLTTGIPKLKQCVAGGQYGFPEGLFFGGHGSEESNRMLVEWLRERFARIRRLGAIDVHTGLGKSGVDSLLVSYPDDSVEYKLLKEHLGARVSSLTSSTSVAYKVRGLMLDRVADELHADESWLVGQEFGTLPVVRVLKALRDENQLHHYGDREDLKHPVKQRLLEAFCPKKKAWREEVVRRGHKLAIQMAQFVLPAE